MELLIYLISVLIWCMGLFALGKDCLTRDPVAQFAGLPL